MLLMLYTIESICYRVYLLQILYAIGSVCYRFSMLQMQYATGSICYRCLAMMGCEPTQTFYPKLFMPGILS